MIETVSIKYAQARRTCVQCLNSKVLQQQVVAVCNISRRDLRKVAAEALAATVERGGAGGAVGGTEAAETNIRER